MLHSTLKNSPKKSQILTSVWKVFAVLLEYCCQANYQMLIRENQRQNQEKVEDIETKMQSEQERLLEVERKLRMEIFELQKRNSD